MPRISVEKAKCELCALLRKQQRKLQQKQQPCMSCRNRKVAMKQRRKTVEKLTPFAMEPKIKTNTIGFGVERTQHLYPKETTKKELQKHISDAVPVIAPVIAPACIIKPPIDSQTQLGLVLKFLSETGGSRMPMDKLPQNV